MAVAAHYTDALLELGRQAGLAAVGVCRAEPFVETRVELERRKRLGLHGDMSFTYRRPEVAADPTRSLPDARSLVVGALRYVIDDSVCPAEGHGYVARYVHHGLYDELRSALGVVSERLRTDGHRSRILVDDNALHDREAAHRAGLGWYGKNANILVPGLGSWVVLGSVLTDAELVAADEPVADGCGTCRRCLDGCPTGAIVEPGVVDARRCLAWLVQAPGVFPRAHRRALGGRLYGCDDCQEVCPPNRRHPPPAGPTDQLAWVDVLGLLDADDDELLARHGRWYIPRREPRYLRRNALLVLGNTADPHDARTVAALERYLRHQDELLRVHAVWAAGALGRSDLVDALGSDPSPLVAAEVAAVAAEAAR
ncbi:MAG: tRNA epoxyqueuosine(34) reductase QueG [Acidimicrobiia bacterium]|nr:tRNA epoxyqueuosine(34) reductase QueG [Acidimicrobiia bacterium]